MSQIRILPTEVANRIAAGEVVERPASIVKELIENSIDAGADRISIKTQNGGKTLIQVIDNGCGMDSDDALLCLEAHATSKIRTTSDISKIITMGFRGEAIPSIASVSRFHLQTRRKDNPEGTEILVEHGSLKQHRPCGCAPGTNIRISHLFANLPGRRKFLKTDYTEDAHIQDCVLMQALAHPEVTFDLTINQRQCFFVPGHIDLKSRIGLLLGKELVPYLLPVEHEEQQIKISGFISRADYTRPGRKEQRIFINHRPAAAESIYHAIRDAYGTLLDRGNYPAVVLYMEMDPERVDVNVHPAKREVRFRDERNISSVISNAIRSTLQKINTTPLLHIPITQQDNVPELLPPSDEEIAKIKESFVTSSTLPKPKDSIDTVSQETKTELSTQPKKTQGEIKITPPPPPPISATPQPVTTPPPPTPKQEESPLTNPTTTSILPIPAEPTPHTSSTSQPTIRLLGQLPNGDIVAVGDSGLILIDPVAAHQRILFEQLIRYKKNQHDIMLQPLLIPATLELPPEDCAIIKHHIKQFLDIGFTINPFGGRTFIIETIPAGIPEQNANTIILEIIEDLRLSGTGKSRSDELRIAKIAARKAVPVKKSQALTQIEAENLLDLLLKTEMPYTTPDGKATMINLPFSEIDRRFLRKK